MCNPIAAAVAMAGVQMYSSAEQGKADYAVAKYNARQQENQAIRTRNKGTEEENRLRQATAEKVSRQRAQLAAGGVDVGAGTAVNIQEGSLSVGEADALTLRNNYQQEAQAMDDQASLTLLTGRNARRMSYLRGLAGGASSGVSTYGALA